MEIPMQIDQISIARAANAAHYEYQSCPASLRGYETELQNGLAMMRGRFAML